MRILVVGASGTVGQAALKALSARHEIVTAGRSSGDVTVDLMDEASVRAMFEKLGASMRWSPPPATCISAPSPR